MDYIKYMKRVIQILSLFVFIAVFYSCKEDKYLDWKYVNERWLIEHQDSTWKTTASGLQYRVIYSGIGNSRPSTKSLVNVNYTGSYISGKLFRNYPTGASLYVGEQVAGLQEGLMMMTRNAIYEFRVPQELGYGKDGGNDGAIPPYSTLIYRVQLKDFTTIGQQ